MSAWDTLECYHKGQGTGMYSVLSLGNANLPIPRESYERAHWEAIKMAESGKFNSDSQQQELHDLIDWLEERMIDED